MTARLTLSRVAHLDIIASADRHDPARLLRADRYGAQRIPVLEVVGIEDQRAGGQSAEGGKGHTPDAIAELNERQAARICPAARTATAADLDDEEPPGWLDCDDYEIDALDSRPDAETDAEARARIEEIAPRACGRCCGTSEELDPARPGEFRICRSCNGSGVEGADPQDLCPECEQPVLVAAIAADEADAPEDDPDPDDGGLGMPAGAYRAPVPAEAVLLFAEALFGGRVDRSTILPTCPGCGLGTAHLYDGATCAGCLVSGRAA